MSRKKYSRKSEKTVEKAILEPQGKAAAVSRVLVPVGLLMIMGAMMMPFFMGPGQPLGWYRWVYAAGALMVLVCRIMCRVRCNDPRLRRLYRIESWSAVFFCVAAAFMFYEPNQMRDWVAFTLAGAVIQIYTSLAIPARKKKVADQQLSYLNSKKTRSSEDDLDV